MCRAGNYDSPSVVPVAPAGCCFAGVNLGTGVMRMAPFEGAVYYIGKQKVNALSFGVEIGSEGVCGAQE